MPSNFDDYVEVKDCIFIKGLRTNANIKDKISDVRKYFQERVGECCVQMTALSKDKRWLFVALKFETASVAEDVMGRYDGKYICGHRLTMSYWRIPRNVGHSGQLQNNSYKVDSRSSSWERCHPDENTEEPARQNRDQYSRDRSTSNRGHAPSDSMHHSEKEDFSDNSDHFRDHQDRNFTGRYKTSDTFRYQEEIEEYFPEHWDSDGGEGSYYEENWNIWDSDHNGGSENLSEREYYDREEELSFQHEGDIWHESEVDQDSDQSFIDQTNTRDYDSRSYPELNTNRNFYCERYEDSLREEHSDSQYDRYWERHEENSYRTEDLCTRRREWHSDREHNTRQDPQTRNQEDTQGSFSPFEQTNHWPRWETVGPSNANRSRLSDPSVAHDTPKHILQADQRSYNKPRDFSGRKSGALSEERPRSDEWLRSNQRSFRDGRRGRRSTSPINLQSKPFGHEHAPFLEEFRKSSPETLDNRTSLDRSHSGDSARSRHGRQNNSPARDTRSSTNRSKRSSSSERNSDFKVYETSPRSKRTTYSSNEQSLVRRQIDSRGYSPRGRHSDKVQIEKGRAEQRTSTRKGSDLRRSLMLHHQRKLLSSSLRGRHSEDDTKRHLLEKGRTNILDDSDNSSGSLSSAESSSPPKGGNRKRHCNDEKTRQDDERAKKRKQTSHSDAASGNSGSAKNKAIKESSESKDQSPRKHKKSQREQRDRVSNKSNTKRADRLLNDLAASLAEDNISLRRPVPDTTASQEETSNSISSVTRRSAESVRGHTRSRDNDSCLEQKEAVEQAVDINLRSMDPNEGVSFGKETGEEAYEGKNTCTDNRATHLDVQCFDDNSEQDQNKVKEVQEIPDLPAVNSSNSEHWLSVDKSAPSQDLKLKLLNPSSEDHNFTEIKRNGTSVTDKLEKTDEQLSSATTVSKKTKEKGVVDQLREANSRKENCHLVDEEFSSGETSTDVIQSSQVFCFPGNAVNSEKEIVGTEEEGYNFEKASPDLTNAEHKTSGGEETYLGDGGSVLNHTKESSLGVNLVSGDIMKEPKTVGVGRANIDTEAASPYKQLSSENCKETLKQIFSNEEGKTSEEENNNMNITGLCLLYTEPDIYSIEVGQVSGDSMRQGSYNTMDRRYDDSSKRTACTLEDKEVDSIYTQQELSNSDSGNVVVGPDGRDRVMNHPQEVDQVSNTAYVVDGKNLCADKEGHVKVTRGESCHITKGGHVCSPRSEECIMKDAKLCVGNRKEEVCVVESICTKQQEIGNKEGLNAKEEKNCCAEQGINGISVVSDVYQEMRNDNQQGKADEKRNVNEEHSAKSAECDDNDHQQEICDEKRIDLSHNNKGTHETNNTRREDKNFGNTRLNASNTEYKVEGNDSSCVNNVIQEVKDMAMEEEGKYDHEDCHVTPQEMQPSKDRNPSGNTTEGEHSSYNKDFDVSCTERKGLFFDTESYVMGNADIAQEERVKTKVVSDVTNTTKQVLNTGDPSSSVSIEGKANTGVIRAMYPTLTIVEPCQSNAMLMESPEISHADTHKSATLSIKDCGDGEGPQKSHHLVPANFENVDMEISSDEEHRQCLIDSTVRVGDGTSARHSDASKPYSPSSPTWKSDEHRSPPPKDLSPYSPTHPTNVSEGDVDQNDPVKELCYDDGEPGGGTRETREEIHHDARKDISKSGREGKNESNANNTALNQTSNYEDMDVITVSSLSVSSSPKSNSGNSHHVSWAKDFVDLNGSAEDAARSGGQKTNNEYDEGVGRNGATCLNNNAADDCSKSDLKPLTRCLRRTQSSPTFASVVHKPRVVYVTATKAKHTPTDSVFQNRTPIFYVTNYRTAKPVKSLSLDEVLGNNWRSSENSAYNLKNSQRTTVPQAEQKNGREAASDVEPPLTEQSCIAKAPLKLGSDGNQEHNEDARKDSKASKIATKDDLAMLSATEGCRNFAVSRLSDCSPGIDKEKSASSILSVAQEDWVDKHSEVILKEQDVASSYATPRVQDTLREGTSTGNEAINVLPNKLGTVSEDSRVFPMILSLAHDVPETRATAAGKKEDDAISSSKNGNNYSGVTCLSIDGDADGGIFPLSCGASEVTSDCKLSTEENVVEDMKAENNCEPVQVQMTSELTDKRPLAPTRRIRSGQPSSIVSYTPEGTIPEGGVGNEGVELDEESSCSKQTFPDSPSRSTNKRPYTDTSIETSHPRKAPRKPLKLFIPNSKANNGGEKRIAKRGGKYARKTSSCTITSADLNFAPGSNRLLIGDMKGATKEDMFVDNESGNMNGEVWTTSLPPTTTTIRASDRVSMETVEHFATTSSCTVTSTDLDFVLESNGLPINEINTDTNSDMSTDIESGKGNDKLMAALSSHSSTGNEVENNSISHGDGFATGNTSPLSAHLSRCSQNKDPSVTSVANVNIEDHKAKGVCTEGKASFVGKESDSIAFRMERLRKKKEEIEQVYKRECQTVINVVKMLVSNDPRLEGVLQNAVRRSLQEMGQRCVQELEKEARAAT